MQDAVNVKAYGARGDGVTDDTAELQRAIDEAWESGCTVYIPAGDYVFTSLTLPGGATTVAKSLRIIGAGPANNTNKSNAHTSATRLICTATSGHAISVFRSAAQTDNNVYILENFTLIGPSASAGAASGNGIVLCGSASLNTNPQACVLSAVIAYLRNVTIYNFRGTNAAGLYLDGVISGRFENVYVGYCTIGIKGFSSTNANVFDNCTLVSCDSIGATFNGAESNVFVGGVFQSNVGDGLILQNCQSWNFINTHFELNGVDTPTQKKWAIKIVPDSSGPVLNRCITFQSCHLSGNATQTNKVSIDGVTFQGTDYQSELVVFTNCEVTSAQPNHFTLGSKSRYCRIDATVTPGDGTVSDSGTDNIIILNGYETRKDFINVKAYGAKSDGTPNDTTAITNAIRNLPASGGTIYFPRGTYVLNSTLTLPNKSVVLLGESAQLTDDVTTLTGKLSVLKFTQTDGTHCIQGDGTGQAVGAKWAIKNLVIYGNCVTGVGANHVGDGIRIEHKSKIALDHVAVIECNNGFYFNDAYIIHALNCIAQHSLLDGFYLNSTNLLTATHCLSIQNRMWGLNIVSGSANVLEGDFSDNGVIDESVSPLTNQGGNIWIEEGQRNTIAGYAEASLANYRVPGFPLEFTPCKGYAKASLTSYRGLIKLGSKAVGSELRLWLPSEIGVQDDGIGNTVAASQGLVGQASPRGEAITNLIPDSSFESGVTGWSGSGSTISHDITTGVDSGKSLKIVAVTTNVNAFAQYSIGAVSANDVLLITGWVKASKEMHRNALSGTYGSSRRTGLLVKWNGFAAATDVYPDFNYYPYADTTWRPFAFLAKAINGSASTAVLFQITNPTARDTIWVTDVQVIKNPPKNINPFDLPYIRTSAGFTRTFSLNTKPSNLTGTAKWDPPDTDNGVTASTTMTVTGARVGDSVSVGFSQAVPAGALLVGAVTAADTVTVTLLNNTGAKDPLVLASGILRADVWQH